MPPEFSLTQKAREYLMDCQAHCMDADQKELCDVILYINNLLTCEVARLMQEYQIE
ncbi:hypothetical protein [Vibrio gazogenes]|nr:hypothetical protein [Vibrio gazogenes]